MSKSAEVVMREMVEALKDALWAMREEEDGENPTASSACANIREAINSYEKLKKEGKP